MWCDVEGENRGCVPREVGRIVCGVVISDFLIVLIFKCETVIFLKVEFWRQPLFKDRTAVHLIFRIDSIYHKKTYYCIDWGLGLFGEELNDGV